jgi:hypothetical protein
MADVEVNRVSPWRARRWWLSLMTNAIGLVDDAAVLTMHCSYGWAGALLVLATDGQARARFLYGAAENEWSSSIQRTCGSRCRRRSRRLVVRRSFGCRWPRGMRRV